MSVQLPNSGDVAQQGQDAANQVQQYTNQQSLEQMWSAAKEQVAEKWIAVGDQAIQNMPQA